MCSSLSMNKGAGYGFMIHKFKVNHTTEEKICQIEDRLS